MYIMQILTLQDVVLLISLLSLAILVVFISVLVYSSIVIIRQKTRSPQQRRMYAARGRPSLGAPEPTIYVSPSNLPPPPKYECMAPPSYEEVVGVHYPNYNIQPITQPISTALQGPSQRNDNVTSITVVNEPRRTSVSVART